MIQSKIYSVENRIKNIMSCCIDLHYLLYYLYDFHCGMSGDWSDEVFWLVSPLSLSQSCQPDHKKQFIRKIIKFVVRDFQNKRQISYHRVIIFFINNNALY